MEVEITDEVECPKCEHKFEVTLYDEIEPERDESRD